MNGKVSPTRENRIFAGRISDLITGSEYTVRYTDFLTPLEQRAAFDIAAEKGESERCFFWGGVPEAERRMAFFLPEWMLPDSGPLGGAFDLRREDVIREVIDSGADSGVISGAVGAVEIVGSSYSVLGHRDYLGALLGLGLERDVIGDISVTNDREAVIFAAEKACEFITSELSSVGRDAVKTYRAELSRGFRINREYEVITDTVMSPRLDGIVKALCGISREKASELVEKGDVTLNYYEETEPDTEVTKGDVLSVRGYGKFIYDGDRGINRRGRLRIDARKYI